MRKFAFLFPGQGSQSVGMGYDFYQEFSLVREIFEMTDEIAKRNISKFCFQGPMEDLTQTINLQPAITAVNLAVLSAIQQEGITCDFCAGHSLGEYSALCAARVISQADAIRLVFKRGELMHRESTRHTGAMHAVIGLPIHALAKLVDQESRKGPVSVANHNAELQVVITGAPEPVSAVSELAKEKGAKSIPLKVSGAWHSQLMKGAEDEFKKFIDNVSFTSPSSGVIHNVTADTLEDPDDIKAIMVRQITSPVRWYDSMRQLIDHRVDVFVEVGPGKVLTGLLKKILPADSDCMVYNVGDLKALEMFLKDVK